MKKRNVAVLTAMLCAGMTAGLFTGVNAKAGFYLFRIKNPGIEKQAEGSWEISAVSGTRSREIIFTDKTKGI